MMRRAKGFAARGKGRRTREDIRGDSCRDSCKVSDVGRKKPIAASIVYRVSPAVAPNSALRAECNVLLIAARFGYICEANDQSALRRQCWSVKGVSEEEICVHPASRGHRRSTFRTFLCRRRNEGQVRRGAHSSDRSDLTEQREPRLAHAQSLIILPF